MTAALCIFGYLVMVAFASFCRACVISKPNNGYDEVDWQFGNAILPIVWPIYLPILAGFVAGKYAKKIHQILNEEPKL